ncbi:MAG: hypothetical protein Q8R16_03285 [bacterium]|nr:hypothetical protein [bacterium]
MAVLPHLAVVTCTHCGQLPTGAPHRQDCFPAFQRALLDAHPALSNVITMAEAGAIEGIFRFWTGIIHALRRSPILVENCVERRWWETTDYVERLLARHTRHSATA